MIIFQAIKKAIEGGYGSEEDLGFGGWYEYDKEDELLVDDFNIIIKEKIPIFASNKYKISKTEIRLEEIWLNPQFWQCLGKAMGWGGLNRNNDWATAMTLIDEWEWQWHKFINHLASGKDIASFFKDLT